MLSFLIADSHIVGAVTWISAVLTLGGFTIAILQLGRIKKSTDAAASAVGEAIRTVRTREQIVELTSAMTYVANAQASISRRNAELGIVHLGLVKSSLLRVRELQLRHGISQNDYQEALEQLGRLLDVLQQSLDSQTEYNAILLLTQLRNIADGMEADAVRLRYLDEEVGD